MPDKSAGRERESACGGWWTLREAQGTGRTPTGCRAMAGVLGGRGSARAWRPARPTEEEAEEAGGQVRPKGELVPEGPDDTRRDACPSHPEETAERPMAQAHFAGRHRRIARLVRRGREAIIRLVAPVRPR